MKTFRHLVAMASFAALAVTAANAQPNYNSCGCPAIGDRTVVNLSTKLTTEGNLKASVTLTCDTLYILDKRLYVLDGQELNIQAGTVIKATTSLTPETAHAVIVAQGGKINAVGTPSCPVIFTAFDDQLDGSYSLCNNAKWGGIIILGKAYNNVKAGDLVLTYGEGVGYIEGLTVPDVRHHFGRYPSLGGGLFYDDDNSGILKYVSIRHGGTIIGANNEINGLTMGSVGRGTTISHVEVISNLDDAFEFFGGTVNVDHLIAAFMGDDSFDWDLGYTGIGQFLYTVQHPDTVGIPSQGSAAFEMDGNDVNGRLPVSTPKFYNATGIGNSSWSTGKLNPAFNPKANTGGRVANSIFANFDKGMLAGTGAAAPINFESINNTFVNCGYLPTNVAGVIIASGNVLSTTTNIDYTFFAGALICDLTGTQINPVPANVADVAATSAVAEGFEYAPYRGAFAPGQEPWTSGWSYYSQLGVGLVLDPACPTDTNGDGVTNGDDYLNVIAAFGNSCN